MQRFLLRWPWLLDSSGNIWTGHVKDSYPNWPTDCSPFKKSTLAQLTKADSFKSSVREIAGDFYEKSLRENWNFFHIHDTTLHKWSWKKIIVVHIEWALTQDQATQALPIYHLIASASHSQSHDSHFTDGEVGVRTDKISNLSKITSYWA